MAQNSVRPDRLVAILAEYPTTIMASTPIPDPEAYSTDFWPRLNRTCNITSVLCSAFTKPQAIDPQRYALQLIYCFLHANYNEQPLDLASHSFAAFLRLNGIGLQV